MASRNINKIAFTGPYSDINFGDYAMLINNIYDLHIKNIVLFSYDSTFINTITNDYLVDYNIEIVEVQLTKVTSDNSVDAKSIIPMHLLNYITNYQELVCKLKEVNVLIVNGGGYFNGLWSMPHRIERLIQIIAPILVANQLGKKIYFFGNSYGPFGNDFDFFSFFLNLLDNVTFGCRDKLYSRMWLTQAGVNTSKIEYIPDDLFFINNEILSLKKNFDILDCRYIVMETYLPIQYVQKNIEYFKDFAVKLFSKYGLKIIFLPFNVGDGGLNQAKYLQEKLTRYDFFDIAMCGYLPIQDAVGIIKGAKLVISSRYHALVVALSVKTPIISVLKDVMGDKKYYYNKNYGMLRLALQGISFDERYYLKLDFLDALTFVSDNYDDIVQAQKINFNAIYKSNKAELNNERAEFLEKIKNDSKPGENKHE